MTTEEKLQELILERYHSIREFTIEIDMPYTTMHSIFKRGIGNSSVNNIIKICKALGISADALADGKIVSLKEQPTNRINDLIEVKDILDNTKDILIHHGGITLEGKPVTVNSIDSIIDSMDIGLEIAKKKNTTTKP